MPRSAVLLKVDRGGLLLAGIDEHRKRKERSGFRQAWWCFPVTPAELARECAPDPEDAEEEREQVVAALGPVW
jgi:hypothetical protein